jgi:glycosyltransferase involved in cell wall biosynthesis
MNNDSIFKEYYSKKKLIDRYKKEGEKEGVDVIIPLFNTNELWEANLFSIFKEIPVKNLLIGDGGCTDNSIEIVKKFPRVKIIDQKDNQTLGYCIMQLIDKVSTKWFVYLHSDVYLPNDWFNEMKKHQKKYDWFECYRKKTILFEFLDDNQNKAERAFSGSQMGRKEAFKNAISNIDDDYLYRNEDIIIRELIETEGYRYGRIQGTFHYHQLMNKRGEKEPKVENISVKKMPDRDWERRTHNMQVKGIIKYTDPHKKYLIDNTNGSIRYLDESNELEWREFKKWVKNTNPAWLKYIKKRGVIKRNLLKIGQKFYYLLQ